MLIDPRYGPRTAVCRHTECQLGDRLCGRDLLGLLLGLSDTAHDYSITSFEVLRGHVAAAGQRHRWGARDPRGAHGHREEAAGCRAPTRYGKSFCPQGRHHVGLRLALAGLLAVWQVIGLPDSPYFPAPLSWVSALVDIWGSGALLSGVLATLQTFRGAAPPADWATPAPVGRTPYAVIDRRDVGPVFEPSLRLRRRPTVRGGTPVMDWEAEVGPAGQRPGMRDTATLRTAHATVARRHCVNTDTCIAPWRC